jgi:hypothetical protein
MQAKQDRRDWLKTTQARTESLGHVSKPLQIRVLRTAGGQTQSKNLGSCAIFSTQSV